MSQKLRAMPNGLHVFHETVVIPQLIYILIPRYYAKFNSQEKISGLIHSKNGSTQKKGTILDYMFALNDLLCI